MRALRDFLLSPASVAIVGQSNDPAKTAGRPLKFLRQAGYAGRVYPVNARRDEVLGERAFASLAALPEVPEHVYVVTPTEAAVETIEECGRLGVKVATVLADGFAEAGPAGAAREARLRDVVAKTGLRLVGPSSLGVVNLREGVMLTANAAFDEKDLPVGRIFAASHSGTMIGALLSRGKARHIGFAGVVSVGNEVDLSVGEICAATLDDPDIDGYLLFLETMRKAAALRAFALAAAARGKPVLAYKLGRSSAARELAVSHTGALAGEDDVADAFLADCGIARVETFEALIEGLPLIARVPARPRHARPPAVAVVTTTAGGATTVVDPLATRGITIAQPSAETYARLDAAGITARARAHRRPHHRGRALRGHEGRARHPAERARVRSGGGGDRLVGALSARDSRSSRSSTAPAPPGRSPLIVVPDAPASARAALGGRRPGFRTPEACADAVAAALRRRVPAPAVAREPARSGGGRLLDELEAYALLDRLGLARAPGIALDGDDRPGARAAVSLSGRRQAPVGARSPTNPISAASRSALRMRAGLVAALAHMRAAVAAHGHQIDRVLVQPMIAGVGEALIGYRVDRDVGPLVMVAAGGVFTEIYRDRSLRLAPVDLDTAREMIAEVRGFKVLAGYRGKPAGDLDALAHAIVALSRLARTTTVAEAEINPLIVRPAGQGVVAVDALVRLG